jgi:hypothetical protein
MKKQRSFSVLQTVGILVFGTSAAVLGTAQADDDDSKEFVPPTVFQAAGPTIASIQSTVDQYRAALGAVDNRNAPGPLASGRREINWDGLGSTATTLDPTPMTRFLDARGTSFTTRGTGFVPRICTYECTICANCVDTVLGDVCPNCGGGFVPRPIRPARNWKGDNYLDHDPASTKVKHRPVGPEAHARFAAEIRSIPPEMR